MRWMALLLTLAAAGAVALTGCGGGGGGGGGAGSGNATLLGIEAEGAGLPLWTFSGGMPVTPAVCPANVFVNGTITFTFDGPVSFASLPSGGSASGSINIISPVSGFAATGSFTVEDDPAFPAGNARRAVFHPTLPDSPSNPCLAGFAAAQTYQVTVPRGGSSPQVVVVGGSQLTNDALTCFGTCDCPAPGTCFSPYTDTTPGAPFVVSTTPPTGNPAPAAIAPSAIAGNTIQIVVSEPLDPTGIALANVRLVDVATGAQVPGSLVFHQSGTLAGGISRIDYVAAAPFPGARVYQLLFGPGVKDFGGNPLQTSPSNPLAQLYFQTAPVPFCPQPPLVESFDTTQNRDSVVGALRWAGDGILQAVYPTELAGTGADGGFAPPAAMTTILDTAEMVAGQSRQGIWNFSDVSITAGATVRIIGPYLAHLRCAGAFSLLGTINVNAGMGNPASPTTPAYDKGPEFGLPNNGSGINCEAIGGVGNAGGGAGGTGSGITPPAGSPPSFQCPLRAEHGEAGRGPTLLGVTNTGTPPNTLYAGGQGGDSGCFPAAVSGGCNPGDLGGLGGAGGTAGRMGEAGQPRANTVACTIIPGVIPPVAQASPVAVAMVPPISIQSAGSGGGGGGDHLVPLNIPNSDAQGGGGGAGGGGLRISCLGAYAQGNAAAGGTILAQGAVGAPGATLSGAGGSGSGGEIWIQTFSTVTITATSVMNVTGPPRLNPTLGNVGCSNQASGGGGAGLIQIESGQGPPATPGFMIFPAPTPTSGAVFSAPPFLYSGASITGQARSKFRHAGYGAPDYTGVVETFSLGDQPGATLTIRYEGAFEAVGSTPQAPLENPLTIKATALGGGPITAANLDELDGYPLIRFVIDVSYPTPPATPLSAILPSVDEITITLDSGANCP